MQTGSDPRDIITPAAFTVAPVLLGHPIARPWRRLAAMLVDLVFGGLLVALLEVPSTFFSAVAAIVVFRILRHRRGPATWWRRGTGSVQRAVLAVLLFGLLTGIWGHVSTRFEGVADGSEAAGVEMGVLDHGLTMAEGAALFRATSAPEADAAARRVRDRLVASGLDPRETRDLRAALDELDETSINPIAIAALRRTLEGIDTAAVGETPLPDPDSLALAYGAALAAGDSGRVVELRSALSKALAGERINELERRGNRLEQQVERLEEEKRENERVGGSLTRLIRNVIDDLGLGFGWLMLYFTAFTTLWRGHTPGKRLFGIRVIRLDGRPIGWWNAFERFGGYSAALATGLLGFAQILWDPNRQAIHDKISATVVVRERDPRPLSVEEPSGGTQSAADRTLDGGREEIVAGERETG